MFSNLGSPLYESFQTSMSGKNNSNSDDGKCIVSLTKNNCIKYDGDKYCKVKPVEEEEDDEENVTNDDAEKDEDEDETETVTNEVSTSFATKDEADETEEEDEVDETEDEDDEDEEDDEEEENSSPTTTSEGFVGNTVEGFVGNSDKINLHFILKCVLFACLFYILCHKDTSDFFVNLIKIKKVDYIYLATVLFFVIYLILNIIL